MQMAGARARAWVVVVVVAVWWCGMTEGSQDDTNKSPFPDWEIPEDKIKFLMEMFGKPLDKAASGLPRLMLQGEEDPEVESEDDEPYWLEGIYLPSRNASVVTNEPCRQASEDIIKIINSTLYTSIILGEGHYWPFFMVDSWGKVPDGLLDGNWRLWGMKEVCEKVKFKGDINIPFVVKIHLDTAAQYCIISTKESPELNGTDVSVNGTDERTPRVGVAMATPDVPSIFQYATCIPSTCTTEDMRASLRDRLSDSGKAPHDVFCYEEKKGEKLDAGDISFIVVTGLLGAIVIGAALVDWCIGDNQKLREGPLRFLLAFSASSNMRKIFTINTKENPAVISCLHGMRVLSMVWVVWGHSYFFTFVYASRNVIGGLRSFSEVIEQVIAEAGYSVDTFLFMGGLLVTYGVLREKERTGKVNWIYYYIHRIIRMLPPIALAVFWCSTVIHFFFEGSIGGILQRDLVETCRRNWWQDVLFVGNLVTEPNCIGQCWYTACDMQLYIFMSLILIPMTMNRQMGVWLLAFATLCASIVPATIIGVNRQNPDNLIFPNTDELDTLDFYDTYYKPWTRGHVYLVGAWAGLLLVVAKEKNIKLNWWQTALGWLLATTLACLVMFGMVDYNSIWRGDSFWSEPLTLGLDVVYGGFGRIAWAVALLWLVFACHTGHGGVINDFLSHPSWQPLSRLTYSIFLVHIAIIYIYLGGKFMPVYLNHLTMAINTIGYLFFSGPVALALSLLTEGPVLAFEKLLIRRPGRSLEVKT